jgi:hypothetical protein
MIDETGGPAFPLDTDCCDVGMTLRDYFAAKAMQADLVGYDGEMWARVAKQAYEMADAMLKERAK